MARLKKGLPRKRRTPLDRERIVELSTESEQPHIHEEQGDPDEFIELDQFFRVLGDENIKLKLYRIEKSGKRSFLEDGSPDTFSESSIQESYGAGDYLVRAIAGGEWVRAKTISIGARVNHQHLRSEESESATERIRGLELRLKEMEMRSQEARESEMRRQHELTLKLAESLGQGGGSRGPSLPDLISSVRDLRELSGNTGSNSLASLKEALEVADQINALREQPKEDEGILSVLKPILPELGRAFLLGQNREPAPGTSPVLSVAPGAALASTPSPATAESSKFIGQTTADTELIEPKKQVLAYLLNMARLGRSPALYAELSIEQVDMHGDQVAARLIQELVSASDFETWFAALEVLDSTLVTQRAWFLEYFETMREAIAGRSQPEPPDGLEPRVS